MTRTLPPGWEGPSLSIQVRTAGTHAEDLVESFRRELRARSGTQERIGEADPVAESARSRSYERWGIEGFEPLSMTIAAFERETDDVLVANIALRPLKKYGLVLPNELIDVLVDACRGVHASHPLRVGVIGEEARVASVLLELWEEGQRPAEGDPGTLWPDGHGNLIWFPGPPVRLSDV